MSRYTRYNYNYQFFITRLGIGHCSLQNCQKRKVVYSVRDTDTLLLKKESV